MEMGPTGLVEGSQYWLCDQQEWASLYTGGPGSDNAGGGSDEELKKRKEFQSAMSSPDTELRDHVFDQCGKAFGAKQYRAVCKAGSVLFIHFDILHRASRQEPTDPEAKKVWVAEMTKAAEAQLAGRARPRMADQALFSERIGVKWRPNFKLQFFRASAPTPTWTGADAPGTKDSFEYTGASAQQQAVWQSMYDWMKGEKEAATGRGAIASASAAAAAAAVADAEVARLRAIISSRDSIAEEPERIGAGYLLGRGAKAGSASAPGRQI
jgi:hypothetical protein